MKRYTLGIAFTDSGVVMVQKNKPAWQAGKLNFVGGKLEEGETIWECMSREFQEETGVHIPPREWSHIGNMSRIGPVEDDNFDVYIFTTHNQNAIHAHTVEDEEIIHVPFDKFSFDSDLNSWYISNIKAIYEFARSSDCQDQGATIEIRYP